MKYGCQTLFGLSLSVHCKFRRKEIDMLQLNEALEGFDSEWNHLCVAPGGRTHPTRLYKYWLRHDGSKETKNGW